jgi:TolA-binding protein
MRDAGDQIRRIGEHYGEAKMEAKRHETYAIFFRDYPEHYAAGQLIMSFGERELKAGNYVGAATYYQQIADLYHNSPNYYDALSRLAQIQREEGNHVGEIEALEFYIEKLSARNKPSHALVVGKFRLATAQREYANTLLKGTSTNEVAEAVGQEELRANAASWLSKAIAGLDDVIKRLTDAPNDYQTNADEKALNEQVKERSVFMRAVCLAQMQHPPDQMPVFRKDAIAAFENYVKLYPKGEYAPRAQLQVGTLYTVLQDANGAQTALEKLRKDYPASEEAKNSVPMLAASLIEMGLRAEGVAMYRQMFAAGGTYTEGQFMAAAKALEEAKEYDMALQAYDKVMSLTKEPGLTATAKLGRARVLAAQKRYTDSRKLLMEFIKEFPRSSLMVDANFLLVDVASEEGAAEKDDKERSFLFNTAVDSLRVIKRYLTEPEQQKEIDLKTGELLMRKMAAEKEFGTPAKVAEYRGDAIVTLNNIIDTTDPGNVKMAMVLEKAYYYALPLMLEHGATPEQRKLMKEHVIESCEAYLRIFPVGKYRTDVQNWLNQARIG